MTGMLLAFEEDVSNTGAFNDLIADGKEFAHYVDLLDAMCDEIGVRTLSSFCNDAGEVREEPFPWFQPDDGLRTVNRLTKELMKQIESAKSKRKLYTIESLIAAMKALEDDLKSAKRANASFALIYC